MVGHGFGMRRFVLCLLLGVALCNFPGLSSARAGVQGRRGRRYRKGPPSSRLSEKDRAELLEQVDLFVFDCDGVIWRGDTLIEGVKETLEFLRRLGKTLVFVTNNSTRSRKQYAAKFLKLGLDWVREENIFASSFAAAAYLSSLGFDKKAYVVGEDGILQELEAANIRHVGGPSDAGKVVDLAAAGGGKLSPDPEIGAVVVGFDRHLNYHKLQYATKCLREIPGCHFVATNRDAVTHLTADDEWAGGGSMVAALAASSQREPVLVGKPSQFMTEFLARRYGISPERMCMVGDRLDTDILFGQAGGMRTLLVLSGVTSEKALRADDNRVFPDHYAPSLASLRAE
eukprot:TRINITY_DN37621_c0_g1_i1.p1 TRINITY_DN37621_c0_g1~~TRINITY_DN37621_c0_g1_i1.p1  ORF type:complete len:343 (+),score=82.47 TRINITY_DN37621_c0_g1_i1:123-1151(+)